MSQRVNLSLVRDDDYLDPTGGDILCRVEVIDEALIGRNAEFSIIAKIEVQDSRGVNVQRVLHTQNLCLSLGPMDIRIPRGEMQAYSYSGRKISVKLHTRLEIDDALLFDTVITDEHELEIGTKPNISTDANSIVEPSDRFNIFKNLKAIPVESRFLTIVLLAVGCVVVAVNAAIGIHDQISPEELTWLYSHVNADGEGAFPLGNSLAGSAGLSVVIWFLMRRQLRKYMRFNLKKIPTIQRDGSYSLSDLVRGVSLIPLRDATLRVVACNMELGQYERGSGTTERTVSFKEPIRGVVLYEARADHIPAHVPIAPYFEGSVDFGAMFSALYPPFTVTGSHGLDVYWEVQLLHPEFVDQELVGPTGQFQYKDFLEA